MNPPNQTLIYRFMHIDNLAICLRRGGLCAPKHTPEDGEQYRTIHSENIQDARADRDIRCGPGGVIHDYVSFYFGVHSPMLYRLHTGWEIDYKEGQEPLIYLSSEAELIARNTADFVFSDGHGLASYTKWFDNLEKLDQLDGETIRSKIWKKTDADPDRQRRKQAEFLVHKFCPWEWIIEITVINEQRKVQVEEILAAFPKDSYRKIYIRPAWYY